MAKPQLKNATDDYETRVTLVRTTIYGRKWAFNSKPSKVMEQENVYHDDPLQPFDYGMQG